VLARRLVKDCRLLNWDQQGTYRSLFDRVLLTAHERIDEP
jgi:hypothetical protein